MCFFWWFVVIGIEHWSLTSWVKAQEEVGVSLLTPALQKAVTVWATGFDNPVFVYYELDATIPCSNKTAKKEPTRTPVWLDDRNRELSTNRLKPSPSSHALHATDVQLEDTGRYTCRYDLPSERKNITYWHHLIVYRMPTLTLEITFGYVTPTCREDRLKQRMENFLPRFATWPARRDEYRISRYYCLPLSNRTRKTSEALFSIVVTHNLNADQTESLSICNAECMKANVLNLLMSSLTLDVTERWKKMEHLNSTNRLFPEFRFDESLFKYKVISDCDFGYELFQQIICLPCRPGTFYDKNTRTCLPCPVNFYQKSFAVLHCNACPLNGTTQKSGTTSPAMCIPLNPVLRTFPLPYVILICVVVIICLILIVIICFQKRQSIKQCCKDLVKRAEKGVRSSDLVPLAPGDDVPKAKSKKQAAREAKFYKRQRKRGLVRVTSTGSLSSFVIKRRMAKMAMNQEPRRIIQNLEIPDKPGLMNMHFERYQPLTTSPSDDGLRSVQNSDVVLAGAEGADTEGECRPGGVCRIEGRTIRYPLPWSGFAPPSEPPSPFVPSTIELVALPNGELTVVPDEQMTTVSPSSWVLSQDTAAAQPMLSPTMQPPYLISTQSLTSDVTKPEHLSAFQTTLSTPMQWKQTTDFESGIVDPTVLQYQSAFQPTFIAPVQPQQSTAIQPITTEASNYQSAFEPTLSTPLQPQQPTAIKPTTATALQYQSAFQPTLSTPVQPQQPTTNQPITTEASNYQSAFEPTLSTPVQPKHSTAIQPITTTATAFQFQNAFQPTLSTLIQPQELTTNQPVTRKASQYQSAFQPSLSTPLQPQQPTAIQPITTTALQYQNAFQPTLSTLIQPQELTTNQPVTTKAKKKYKTAFQPTLSTPVEPKQSTANQPVTTKAKDKYKSAFDPTLLTPVEPKHSTANQPATTKAMDKNKSAFEPTLSTPVQPQQPTTNQPITTKAKDKYQSAFEPTLSTPLEPKQLSAKQPATTKAKDKYKNTFPPSLSTPVQPQQSTANSQPVTTTATALQYQSAIQPTFPSMTKLQNPSTTQ